MSIAECRGYHYSNAYIDSDLFEIGIDYKIIKIRRNRSQRMITMIDHFQFMQTANGEQQTANDEYIVSHFEEYFRKWAGC